MLNDEVYRYLEYDDSERLPAAAACAALGISLGVMSKAFGLAGLRIGWIATRDRQLRARITRLRDYTTICASAPSEILACIALRAKQKLIHRALQIIESNLALWSAFFERNCNFVQWTPPRAGSVAFPRLISGAADRFAADLVEKTGVLVLPGSKFGFPGAHFRIGLGRPNIGEPLALLESHLQAAHQR